MKTPETLQQVAAFHRTFNHPILDTPAIPSPDRCRLRVALLTEELQELQEAIDQTNIVAVADALCDLQYVLAGAVLEFGLGDKFKDLFNEVHRSNMSKACVSFDEAERTQKYFEGQGCHSYILSKNDIFIVFRAEDNKTLKSINYSPADLAAILVRE